MVEESGKRIGVHLEEIAFAAKCSTFSALARPALRVRISKQWSPVPVHCLASIHFFVSHNEVFCMLTHRHSNMYSPSVFASLTPCDEKNKARSAFKLPQNERWFHEATGGIAEEPTIDSREPTPAPEASSRDQDLGATDRLIVTFDELLKELENFPNGIQFGTNPVVCHVLLGHRGTGGISGRQYNITVDDNLCIWLHDYHSTHGTAVAHNGQNETEVRKDTWLLAFEPGSRKRLKNITIHSGGLVVKLEFPNHGEADTQYVANLRAFVKKCKGAVLPVGALGLDSEPTTATPSQAQTPGERPVYYNDGKIGEGEFGVVRRFIKLRDGKYFAAKSFLRTPNKRRHDQDNPEWLAMIRREFTIMRDNPHVSAPLCPPRS